MLTLGEKNTSLIILMIETKAFYGNIVRLLIIKQYTVNIPKSHLDVAEGFFLSACPMTHTALCDRRQVYNKSSVYADICGYNALFKWYDRVKVNHSFFVQIGL